MALRKSSMSSGLTVTDVDSMALLRSKDQAADGQEAQTFGRLPGPST